MQQKMYEKMSRWSKRRFSLMTDTTYCTQIFSKKKKREKEKSIKSWLKNSPSEWRRCYHQISFINSNNQCASANQRKCLWLYRKVLKGLVRLTDILREAEAGLNAMHESLGINRVQATSSELGISL